MYLGHDYVGLHLGAEYNGNHGTAGPPMNEIVDRYLRDGTLADLNYFRLLVEQVRCFRRPEEFYYDDVSRIRATGAHSSVAVYRENVRESTDEIVRLVTAIDPRIIIIGGGHAHKQFVRQILPKLTNWRGDLVRARNPSVQGHRGSLEQWVSCYRSFRTDLAARARPPLVRHWHLYAQNVDGPLQLRPA